MSWSVYNTLTKRVELFSPRSGNQVDIFVCGPTVYDLCHVGHAKTYTQFDFVVRLLRYKGYDVRYIQNITDVDDKIITKAKTEGVDPAQVAERYEAAYIQDMQALHNTAVNQYARAHDYIEPIVDQVRRLIERGHAYQLGDGWYFDLATFPEYGKLSGRTTVQAEDAVARIDENGDKRNLGDFALWKARKEGEPYWESALGEGRPGWHIEDTAITEALFGAQYDIHGGAVDLIFPHHEAEIAQLEAATGNVPLARYWMHTGLLRVEGAKMSKSLHNFLTIREALERADYRTLRYVFLCQQLRSQMELTEAGLESSRSARDRVETFARGIDGSRSDEKDAERATGLRYEVLRHLDNDLDTPGALAALFTFIRDVNRSGIAAGAATLSVLHEINGLFDVFNLDSERAISDEIRTEIRLREQLREEGRYAEADQIRGRLRSQGILLKDTPQGTEWWMEE